MFCAVEQKDKIRQDGEKYICDYDNSKQPTLEKITTRMMSKALKKLSLNHLKNVLFSLIIFRKYITSCFLKNPFLLQH